MWPSLMMPSPSTTAAAAAAAAAADDHDDHDDHDHDADNVAGNNSPALEKLSQQSSKSICRLVRAAYDGSHCSPQVQASAEAIATIDVIEARHGGELRALADSQDKAIREAVAQVCVFNSIYSSICH